MRERAPITDWDMWQVHQKRVLGSLPDGSFVSGSGIPVPLLRSHDSVIRLLLQDFMSNEVLAWTLLRLIDATGAEETSAEVSSLEKLRGVAATGSEFRCHFVGRIAPSILRIDV